MQYKSHIPKSQNSHMGLQAACPQNEEDPALTSDCREGMLPTVLRAVSVNVSFQISTQFLFMTGFGDKQCILRYLITLYKAMLNNFIEF